MLVGRVRVVGVLSLLDRLPDDQGFGAWLSGLLAGATLAVAACASALGYTPEALAKAIRWEATAKIEESRLPASPELLRRQIEAGVEAAREVEPEESMTDSRNRQP